MIGHVGSAARNSSQNRKEKQALSSHQSNGFPALTSFLGNLKFETLSLLLADPHRTLQRTLMTFHNRKCEYRWRRLPSSGHDCDLITLLLFLRYISKAISACDKPCHDDGSSCVTQIPSPYEINHRNYSAGLKGVGMAADWLLHSR